ncbi:MAG: AMP-binding protein [Bacteroidetes bacterium]|nr:AMP-binding protein [Bacteroidota bacterium]
MFITINNLSFNSENFDKVSVKFHQLFNQNLFLFEFLKSWYQEKLVYEILTSGSTSSQKQIRLKRTSLIAGANQIIDFLKLKNENILCCIPIDKIGGLMMIVRALVGDFKITITTPTADPMYELVKNHDFSFVSLVPYQLINILNNEESFSKLNRFKIILIGGAALNNDLQNKIKKLKPDVYHTFGMTETCSNFALKKLNNESWKYYKPYQNIKLKVDSLGILSVKGKQTDNKWIKTNDIVKIYDDGFEFIGRSDFVINTGGFKISPEVLEKKIQNLIDVKSENTEFLISLVNSQEWGQMIVLVHNNILFFENNDFKKLLKSSLEKHEMPKKFVFLEKIPKNKSMKTDRKSIQNIIAKI